MRRRDHDEEPIRVEINDDGLETSLGQNLKSCPNTDELQVEIERLTTELEEERNRTKEEHDSYLRALADFSNYRKRHQEEYLQAAQFATQEVILKFLPAIDNFQRALQSAEGTVGGLVEGVRATLRLLEDVLKKEGVQRIEAVGKQFDPMVHEAIMRVETDEYPENTVVEEAESGYMLGDRVIRPAKVVVAARAA